MDNSITHLVSAPDFVSLCPFGLWNEIQPQDGCKTDGCLRFDSGDASNFCDLSTRGRKRGCSLMNGIERPEPPLLALGSHHLPCSSDISKMGSTSLSTISSVKESDEESSVDVGLNFQLSLGNGNMISPKMTASSAENMLNLELSLSTAPYESDSKSIEPLLHRHKNDMENLPFSSPVLSSDVGSASSCLIFGSYLQPNLHNSFTTISSPCSKQICMDNYAVRVVSELPSTSNQKVKSPVACTSGAICIQQRSSSSSTRKCQFQGCEKGARGASGFCIAHGGGRRCQKPGCQKGAEGRTIYCKAHGGGRRCEFLGCTKSAEGRTDYCIAHGGGRRCSHNGCGRAARGKSGLCIRHGGGKRCQKENCTKSAEGHSGLCISHGGGRRCHFPQCSKGAQGSTLFCKAHGGGKRCTFLGCTKGAEGSTPFCKGHGGGKRCLFQGGGVCPKSVHGGTQFCVAHGGGKRCAIPGCTKSARGRTSFCVRHGGGRRCKSEGCDKSAQGSTDFCKAHGGGKRCSWGQAGSQFGSGETPCDKLPRSKSTLCTEHSALVQDSCIHGGGTLGLPSNQRVNPIKPEKLKEVPYIFQNRDNVTERSIDCHIFDTKEHINPLATPQVSLSEGRVHGGSLIALFSGNSYTGSKVSD